MGPTIQQHLEEKKNNGWALIPVHFVSAHRFTKLWNPTLYDIRQICLTEILGLVKEQEPSKTQFMSSLPPPLTQSIPSGQVSRKIQ